MNPGQNIINARSPIKLNSSIKTSLQVDIEALSLVSVTFYVFFYLIIWYFFPFCKGNQWRCIFICSDISSQICGPPSEIFSWALLELNFHSRISLAVDEIHVSENLKNDRKRRLCTWSVKLASSDDHLLWQLLVKGFWEATDYGWILFLDENFISD